MIVSFAGTDKNRDVVFNKCKDIFKNSFFQHVEKIPTNNDSDSNFIIALNKDLTNLHIQYKTQKKDALFLQRSILDSAIMTFLNSKIDSTKNFQTACFLANQFLDNLIFKYNFIFLLLSEKDLEYNKELEKILKNKNIRKNVKILSGSNEDKINQIKKTLDIKN